MLPHFVIIHSKGHTTLLEVYMEQDKVAELKSLIYSEVEAARALGCSRKTLAKEREKGNVKFRRVGGSRGRILYTRESILQLVEGANG
jgi:hypothetical protein